jgi:hypothetical protein
MRMGRIVLLSVSTAVVGSLARQSEYILHDVLGEDGRCSYLVMTGASIFEEVRF